MRAPAIALLVTVAGCASDFADDYHLVTRLRALGARAEPAEVPPGGTTQLTALAVTPDGSPIDVAWSACLIAPIAGSGTVNSDCVTTDTGQSSSQFAPLGHGQTLTAVLPMFSPALLGPPDDTGGLYLPIHLRLRAAGATEDAILRLRITDPAGPPSPPNHNPRLAAVQVTAPLPALLDDLANIPVGAGSTLSLSATFVPGSAEDYRALDCPGASVCRTELLDVTWFASAGEFAPGSTGDGDETTLDLGVHPLPAGTPVDVWVVAHDGRGGSDFAHGRLLPR